MFRILIVLFAISLSAMPPDGDDPDSSVGSIGSVDYVVVDERGPWNTAIPDPRTLPSNLSRLSDGLLRHHRAAQFARAAELAQETAVVQRLLGLQFLVTGFETLARIYRGMHQWAISGQSPVQGRQILAEIQRLRNPSQGFLNTVLERLYQELENLLISNIGIRESMPLVVTQLDNAHLAGNFIQAALHAEQLAHLYNTLGESNTAANYQQLAEVFQRTLAQFDPATVSISELRNLIQFWNQYGDRILAGQLNQILLQIYNRPRVMPLGVRVCG